MIPEVTSRMLANSDSFIQLTVGDIYGVKQGKQWDLPYKYTVFTHDYGNKWWVQYSIKTGYTGETAYENSELAQKLNKMMNTLDRKGDGYFLAIPVKSKYYLFSNVYATKEGYLTVGERRASNLREDIPQYLPTPTF